MSQALPNKQKRDKWVNVKVTAEERANWQAQAQDAGVTVADLIRQNMGDAELVRRDPVRRRSARRVDPKLLAELGRLGNNLNQIARWANTYKAAAEAIEITAALAAIERELLFLLPGDREAGGSAPAFDGGKGEDDAG